MFPSKQGLSFGRTVDSRGREGRSKRPVPVVGRRENGFILFSGKLANARQVSPDSGLSKRRRGGWKGGFRRSHFTVQIFRWAIDCQEHYEGQSRREDWGPILIGTWINLQVLSNNRTRQQRIKSSSQVWRNFHFVSVVKHHVLRSDLLTPPSVDRGTGGTRRRLSDPS